MACNTKSSHNFDESVVIFGTMTAMGGSRMFCQRGSNFDIFFSSSFLADEGEREEPTKYHYKQAILGLPEKCHLNGVLLACR